MRHVLRARALVIIAGLMLHVAAASTDETLVERGRYLVHAGGCITCHTEESAGAVPLDRLDGRSRAGAGTCL